MTTPARCRRMITPAPDRRADRAAAARGRAAARRRARRAACAGGAVARRRRWRSPSIAAALLARSPIRRVPASTCSATGRRRSASSLVLDRLSALMLAADRRGRAAGAAGCASTAGRGAAPHFHALFQFQLAGPQRRVPDRRPVQPVRVLRGAADRRRTRCCCTAAGGRARCRPALHYVVVNLVGSSLFLVAVSLLYGVTGTLNLADLASAAAAARVEPRACCRPRALLLLVVFALKAAMLPLGFWLPATYAQRAGAGRRAVRGDDQGRRLRDPARDDAAVRRGRGAARRGSAPQRWSSPGSRRSPSARWARSPRNGLSRLAAFLVVASAGTLVAAVSLGASVHAGALYYLVHSTLAAALLFLVVDAHRRGSDRGPGTASGRARRSLSRRCWARCSSARRSPSRGCRRLSGFIGKVMLLAPVLGRARRRRRSARRCSAAASWRCSRWRAPAASCSGRRTARRPAPAASAPAKARRLALLSAMALGLTVFAAPVQRYAEATAAGARRSGGVRRTRARCPAGREGRGRAVKRLLPAPVLSAVLLVVWLLLNNTLRRRPCCCSAPHWRWPLPVASPRSSGRGHAVGRPGTIVRLGLVGTARHRRVQHRGRAPGPRVPSRRSGRASSACRWN